MLDTPIISQFLEAKGSQIGVKYRRVPMQQVIDRTLDDTETAEQIAHYEEVTESTTFLFLIEGLYKTSEGDYFSHGRGGAQTNYATRTGDGTTVDEKIRAFTAEQALDWCENREIDGEIIADEFPDLIDIPDPADD